MEIPCKLFLLCGLISAAVAFSQDYVSEVRQNFQEKSNSDLNNQMAAFQRASLVYMAYASHFDRGNVNLPGFRRFFLVSSQAALNDSQKVIDYINDRGGHQQFPILDMKAACRSMKVPNVLRDEFPKDGQPRICYFIMKTDPLASMKKKAKKSYFRLMYPSAAKKPVEAQSSQEDWQHGLMALTDALIMERSLNRQLRSLVRGAVQRKDVHLRHTVEDSFLSPKVERIKKLAELIQRLRLYSKQDYPLGEYVMDLEMGN